MCTTVRWSDVTRLRQSAGPPVSSPGWQAGTTTRTMLVSKPGCRHTEPRILPSSTKFTLRGLFTFNLEQSAFSRKNHPSLAIIIRISHLIPRPSQISPVSLNNHPSLTIVPRLSQWNDPSCPDLTAYVQGLRPDHGGRAVRAVRVRRGAAEGLPLGRQGHPRHPRLPRE